MTHPTPLPAVELDAIGYSKRILALVDDYTDRPNRDTRAAIRAQLLSDFDGLLTAAQARAEAVENLLWSDHPECCGSPVVGAEYMGQREMVCCGCPEPALLSDAQIVATLRQQFPEKRVPATDSAIGGKGA